MSYLAKVIKREYFFEIYFIKNILDVTCESLGFSDYQRASLEYSDVPLK